MAVKDESLHHATNSLILQKPHFYYRAEIEAHWQLRSLVCSPEHGVVYFASKKNIYALFPKTKEREIITTLSFDPTCLIVANGWLCCGGHNGNYAAISLKDRRAEDDFSLNLDPDPTGRSSQDMDATRRSILRDTVSILRRLRGADCPIRANVKKIGMEGNDKDDAINNAITLWFPPELPSIRAHKKPVAVVSNNDKSVYILNLEDSEVVQRLTYPDCVNRAVISPDGDILVAVLDDPFLYVHVRKQSSDPSPGLFNTKDSYKWAPSCRIQMEGQTQAEKSDMTGSFALSFSSSGKYLAVASQFGIISVFETAALTKEDSEPVAIFTSSRPNRPTGAVRSMAFAPGPVDLLAWTEYRGRVGVADMRNLFLSRQLLHVDSRHEFVERVRVSEIEKPAELSVIDPRLLPLRTELPPPDYLSSDFERRQLRNLTREMLNQHQSPLTSEELEVLQAHRIARRQRDALADATRQREAHPNSEGTDIRFDERGFATIAPGSLENPPWIERDANTHMGRIGSTSTIERRISTAGLPAAIRDFVNPEHRTAASFRSFINERNQDRERRNQQQETATRSSVILAAAERAMEQDSAGSSGLSTNVDRISSTPPRLLGGADSPAPNNPWAEIDALYRERFPATGDPSRDHPTRIRYELDEDDRRDIANRIRRPWQPEIGISRDDNTIIVRGIVDSRRSGEDDLPPETMGLSWSPDGRILFVGAADGIYQYHVNVAARRMFPSIVMR